MHVLNEKVQHDVAVQVEIATDTANEFAASSDTDHGRPSELVSDVDDDGGSDSDDYGDIVGELHGMRRDRLSPITERGRHSELVSDVRDDGGSDSDDYGDIVGELHGMRRDRLSPITERGRHSELVSDVGDDGGSDSDDYADIDVECQIGELHGMRRDKGMSIITKSLPINVAHLFGADKFFGHDLPRYVLVDITQLMQLFSSQCPNCQLSKLSNNITYVGAVLHSVVYCNVCKFEKLWTSSPLLRRPRTYPLNVHVTSSVILSGCQFGKLENFFRTVGARFISRTTYERMWHSYLQPAVKIMYSETQSAILSGLRTSSTPRTLIGDAQADSPGTCAKNQSYAVMDYDTGYITAIAVLDKRETQLVSTTMELHGLIRCLYEMLAANVSVNKICTDQHVMVCKFFRLIQEEAGIVEPVRSRKIGDTVECSIRNALRSRNTVVDDKVVQRFRVITHRLDVWHKAKAVQARITAAGQKKTCRNLLSWSSAVRNHFWYACEMCAGNSVLLKEIWTSILCHVTGKHEWEDGHCYHDPIPEGTVGDEKPIIPYKSDAWRILHEIVFDDSLLKDMSYCCDYL
jgi:hypothetical protein